MAAPANLPGIFATILALGLAPTVGMMLGGGWFAAFAFVGAATIVTMRALAKHNHALAEPDLTATNLTPQQAIGMLSALHGKPLAGSIAAAVAELEILASTDPALALRRVDEVLKDAPRNVGALALCARLAFATGRADAVVRWTAAVRIALDTGVNRIAASTFVAHREHRDALQLEPPHRRALARALEANGHADDARWCLAR